MALKRSGFLPAWQVPAHNTYMYEYPEITMQAALHVYVNDMPVKKESDLTRKLATCIHIICSIDQCFLSAYTKGYCSLWGF